MKVKVEIWVFRSHPLGTRCSLLPPTIPYIFIEINIVAKTSAAITSTTTKYHKTVTEKNIYLTEYNSTKNKKKKKYYHQHPCGKIKPTMQQKQEQGCNSRALSSNERKTTFFFFSFFLKQKKINKKSI